MAGVISRAAQVVGRMCALHASQAEPELDKNRAALGL